MLQLKSITISTLLCISVFASSVANAAIVQFSVNGEITRATVDNYFGLSVGDTITLSGEYDDGPIGAGVTYIDFALTYNNFSLEFGNTTYVDEDDVDSLATMYFYEGIFDGLDFVTSDGKFDSIGYVGYVDPNTGVLYDDFSGHNNQIGGNWIVDSFQITPVPVPAALWLFGSGLVFLSGFAKRKQNQA